MGRLRTLVVCAATVAISGAAARAADMPDYSSPLPFPSRERSQRADELYSGWYLRGDVGYRFQRVGSAADFGSNYTSNSIENAFLGSAGAGYKLQWFRADLTGDYGWRSLYNGADRFRHPDGLGQVRHLHRHAQRLHRSRHLGRLYPLCRGRYRRRQCDHARLCDRAAATDPVNDGFTLTGL